MAELFESGRVVDLILALTALEAGSLLAVRHFTGRGVESASLVATLLAGSFLLLALRSAFENSGWIFTALFLLAALLAHVADLSLRWDRSAQRRQAAPDPAHGISSDVPGPRRPRAPPSLLRR